MSIFGKLDAANIPTNPNFVEQGEYEAEVTDAQYKTNRDNRRQLVIEYTITSSASQYLGSKVYDYFTLVDEDMDLATFEMLPAEEKKNIRRAMSALKRRLCGNGASSQQPGLGVPSDDLNDENWNPADLKGRQVNLAVSNYGNDGVNVRWVNLSE